MPGPHVEHLAGLRGVDAADVEVRRRRTRSRPGRRPAGRRADGGDPRERLGFQVGEFFGGEGHGLPRRFRVRYNDRCKLYNARCTLKARGLTMDKRQAILTGCVDRLRAGRVRPGEHRRDRRRGRGLHPDDLQPLPGQGRAVRCGDPGQRHPGRRRATRDRRPASAQDHRPRSGPGRLRDRLADADAGLCRALGAGPAGQRRGRAHPGGGDPGLAAGRTTRRPPCARGPPGRLRRRRPARRWTTRYGPRCISPCSSAARTRRTEERP